MKEHYNYNNFFEVGFVDESDFAHNVYEELCNGEKVDDFEYYDWEER